MLGARCVHMIWQAEHALMRERLDALSAHLRFGRADTPIAEAEWPRDWQDRLAALIQLDRSRHQPKVVRLCSLLEPQGAEAVPTLDGLTRVQESEEGLLAGLQVQLIRPWTGLAEAGERLIDLFAHWRAALLDRLQIEQQLLHLAVRLLNRDDWSALASAFSRLTYPDAGLVKSAAVGTADEPAGLVSGAALPDSATTAGAVRRIWPARTLVSVRRLPQVLPPQEGERLRSRSVLLRRPVMAGVEPLRVPGGPTACVS
jgi:hypothetical protein